MHLSLSQKRWVFDDFDPVKTRRLQIEYGLNPLLAQCLSPVLQHQDPQQWLFPSIEHLHDPYKMKNMSVAVERLEKALRDKERIRIVTDYDVDGTTSSLILQSVCRLLGGGELIDYHIPSRFTEGYGFSVVAAQKAIRDKIKLIVTADIGVRDHEAVRIAAEGGVDVIICDHHLPAGSSVPDAAVAVLCPPQEGCLYPNPALAACGVSLKLAQALLFRSAKWKDRPNVVWKIIRSMLKVVAIGTVADVVSLATIENRSIVALGLAELQDMRSHSVGLRALLEASRVNGAWITASTIGYQIAPRINAAGRLRRATEVIELMNEKDAQRARVLAKALDDLNSERRDIERKLVQHCFSSMPAPLPNFITVWGEEEEGWHRGIVGIVASRLRDKTNRPTAVISICGNEARGSVRSVPGIHAVEALESAKDLLPTFGGHKAAAGFSVPLGKLEVLRERLDRYVLEQQIQTSSFEQLDIRASCKLSDINLNMAQAFFKLGPFGKDNPMPLLCIKGIRPRSVSVLKNSHIKFKAGDFDVLWWNAKEHLKDIQSQTIDLAAEIDINRWNQRMRVQLVARDIRIHSPEL